MYKEFRELLDNATGTSEHIIAIVVDIRGFSDFCQKTDSYDVANYIKRVYMKIIDNYFPDAPYYKPTGDGLLVIQSCPAASIKDVTSKEVQRCLGLLSDFEELCKDDPLIYFETPKNIGIGMSRGSACKISSGSKTLDYSGRVINLSSRLMDLARPSGIVFDASLGFHFLSKEIQDQFLKSDIYVRGIAEKKPIAVYYTKKYTILPHSVTLPLREPTWETETEDWLCEEVLTAHDRLLFALKAKPMDPKQIVVRVSFVRQEASAKYQIQKSFPCDEKNTGYMETGKTSNVWIKKDSLETYIKENSLQNKEIITFLITYPIEQAQ
jgi:hypothetical protein